MFILERHKRHFRLGSFPKVVVEAVPTPHLCNHCWYCGFCMFLFRQPLHTRFFFLHSFLFELPHRCVLFLLCPPIFLCKTSTISNSVSSSKSTNAFFDLRLSASTVALTTADLMSWVVLFLISCCGPPFSGDLLSLLLVGELLSLKIFFHLGKWPLMLTYPSGSFPAFNQHLLMSFLFSFFLQDFQSSFKHLCCTYDCLAFVFASCCLQHLLSLSWRSPSH